MKKKMPEAGLQLLEAELDGFSPAARRAALEKLAALARKERLRGRPIPVTNLHAHSFFSYNAYGYSPGHIVWLAFRRGWETVGVVDFDVLDGLEETVEAGRLLGVRAVAGLETRVFIRECADLEINSPGEPGVFYLMGLGFYRAPGGILDGLRALAESRSRSQARQVGALLAPEVVIDYETDVLALTPSGNATERHLVEAIDVKARLFFRDEPEALAAYWAERLRRPPGEIARVAGDRVAFRELLRSRLMKKGGPGYAAPGKGAFPALEETVEMVISSGGLPTATWLDGTSAGESDPAEWLRFLQRKGLVVLNIIPDRNWNIPEPGEKALKTEKMRAVVRAAAEIGMPLVAGTEMNRPGQKLADDFHVPELASCRDLFRSGAFFVYGHAMMGRLFGRGFTSPWAARNLPDRFRRLEFYNRFGRLVAPGLGKESVREAAAPGGGDDPETHLAWARSLEAPG